MKRGVPVIDKNRCKGCGLCVENCPKSILVGTEDVNDQGVHYTVCVDPAQCIACGICALMCPDAAIEVYSHPEAV